MLEIKMRLHIHLSPGKIGEEVRSSASIQPTAHISATSKDVF